jgi:hypothetical protein
MKKKLKDRHLDIPSEANRDKHINFVALERNEDDPSDVPATGKLAEEQEIKKASEQYKNSEKKD